MNILKKILITGSVLSALAVIAGLAYHLLSDKDYV